MIQRIRNSFWTKVVAVYVVMNVVGEIVFPTMAMALTSGPVSIDQASFEPAATSEMVDLATGDFTYNIPLLDVDGYPINIAYHGGVGMDQDASMVGLGWTLNVGAVNRSTRGLPDDFNGDEISTEMNMRPRYSIGGSIGISAEVVGFDPDIFSVGVGANIGIGCGFDNYTGFSTEVFAGATVHFTAIRKIGGNIGVQVNSGSQDGLSISPSAGITLGNPSSGPMLSIGIGYNYNSIGGLQSRSLTGAFGSTGDDGQAGISSVSVMPLSTVSYTPNITFETATVSRDFDFSAGGSWCGVDAEAQFRAYKSMTCNKHVTETAPAYGYLNQEQHLGKSKYLMDFNEEGITQTNKHIAYLPITNSTYDFFSATAQGVGFTFRPFRSEVGIVSEMNRNHDINGVGISAEIGGGLLFQAGINVNIPSGNINSGKWVSSNLANATMNYTNGVPTGANEHLYEKNYFKKFGNRATIDEAFYENMGGDNAVKQKIVKAGPINHVGQIQFVDETGAVIFEADDNNHYKKERDVRNTSIQYLSALESDDLALSTDIELYNLSNYTYTTGAYSSSTESRYGTLSTEAKKHHLSEMTVLEGDGSRYVYGIPVINRTTNEVTFNVSDISGNTSLSPLTKDCDNGLVTYDAGVENSINNERGANNLYLNRTVPAYASSYLLTAYLSSNYIDRTLNGPTPDDFGNYTKFNYAKTGITKWRFPYEYEKAAYNEGLKSDPYDDMGSYVYGERDQMYLHSIESKNFVAEFHYETRYDGYGVEGEDGGIASTNYSRKLVRIELHTRRGKIQGSPAIKTVHFEYDYSLCQGIPSYGGPSDPGNEGKLTLTAIYFTYGNSSRGKLHKYTFDYSATNPDYELGADDRWGNYKPISPSATCDETGTLTNIEFPYAEQDKTDADTYSNAWMLETIHLPSGSEINVDIESDDYNYVQDKKVTKMFNIKGFSSSSTFVDGDKEILYTTLVAPHNFLHVEVGDLGTTSPATAKSNFIANYLTDDQIYFKILVKVSPLATLPYTTAYSGDQYEYISGYAKVDVNSCVAYDAIGDPNCETVAIKLANVSLEDDEEVSVGGYMTNPVTKASWQFTRKYLPIIMNPVIGDIYDHDDNIDCSDIGEVPEYDEDDEIEESEETKEERQFLKNIIETSQSHLQNVVALNGVNFMMGTFKYSAECVPSKSWIKLKNGNNPKLGGGHRVKQITVLDNWDDVKLNESASVYGSTYVYNTLDGTNEISSGVASYEPIHSGGDENPMRKPVSYTIDIKMRVNDEEFQELPFGESIFANPGVVYSRVEVANIEYANVVQNSTGRTVHEYYTAKDFPVRFDFTGKASASAIESTNDWSSLFTSESFSYLTMSQGYSISVNDMHGKFKSKKIYGATIDPSIIEPEIYSMEHKYYVDNADEKKLNNKVPTVNETGVISDRYIGQDLDVVVNLNETKTNYQTTNVDAGLTIVLCYPPPPLIPVPIPLPSVWYSDYSLENRFRSSVTTKVTTSTGILDEVILVDKGRYKSSKNLLFDANTGVPVVTEINHEQPVSGSTYEKPIYQYDYPAYWMYKGMGLASENWGAKFGDIVDNSGSYYEIDLTNKELYLNPGDELAVYNISDNSIVGKYWIVEDETNGDYYLVDETGNNPGYTPANVHYKVIRSGRRNLLGSTAASVTSLTKFTTSPYADSFSHTQVLNASAVEYTDEAYGYVSSNTAGSSDFCGLKVGEESNPYIWGLRGNWNLFTSYVYDSGRDQTTGHSRIDGVLDGYVEFWENTSGVWGKNTDSQVAEKWIQAAVATLFDREGFNLESKDALGIYSAIQLGYNRTLKIAEAVNARYYQFGFDGFEDRAYDVSSDCTTPHFRFSGTSVISGQAHTGRHSALIIGEEGTDYALLNSPVKLEIDHATSGHSKPYIIQQQELINKHTYLVSATEPSKYVLTFWAKVGDKLPTEDGFNDLSVEIEYNSSLLTNLVEHRTNIIDGWKRIEVIFELPALTGTPTGSEYCEVRLNKNTQQNVYFDDIRIQPYNSEMVSYVIDPVSMRLWATLDSRNFATFYQYDEEGSLVRIIQETERGRFTVQENRAGIRIN